MFLFFNADRVPDWAGNSRNPGKGLEFLSCCLEKDLFLIFGYGILEFWSRAKNRNLQLEISVCVCKVDLNNGTLPLNIAMNKNSIFHYLSISMYGAKKNCSNSLQLFFPSSSKSHNVDVPVEFLPGSLKNLNKELVFQSWWVLGSLSRSLCGFSSYWLKEILLENP